MNTVDVFSVETWIVGTACMIFVLGLCGTLVRRNPLVILMCVELMINAAIALFIVAGRMHQQPVGQSAGLMVLVLGAAEVVVGLGLALAIFRKQSTVSVDDVAEVTG